VWVRYALFYWSLCCVGECMCVLGKPCFMGACVLWVRVCVLDMLFFLGECVVCVCVLDM
jgi:hypothetical protein